MRLAILALSAAAISGCSWIGGHKVPAQAGCYPAIAHGYGGYAQGYGHSYQQTAYHGVGYAQSGACASGQYGVQTTGGFQGAGGFQGNGYGFQNYGVQGGMAGYGAPAQQAFVQQGVAGQGFATQTFAAQGGSAYVASGYPAGFAGSGATTLGATAPFGSAVGGQFATSGQFGTAPGVQTVIGSPIYAPQPYPAPYPVPVTGGPACCGTVGYGGGFAAAGAAMRLGIEGFAGTEFDATGDIFTKKSDGPPDGDYSIPIRVGDIDPISYKDAFGAAKTIGGTLAYDHSPKTTVFASVGFSEAEGQTVENYTTVQDGTWASQVFTPAVGSSPRSLDGEFTDLKTTTLEAGLRQYSGNPHGLRGYVGVSGGFYHNNDVTFTQTYSDTGANYGQRTFIDSGWNPTAAAVVGAELPVGPRAAIGAEWGVRWRDSMNTAAPSEDRITVPLSIRGRLAF